MDRRSFLLTAAAAGLLTGKSFGNSPGISKGGPYKLPPLPYPENALAPVISANTVQFHYGKHHRTYVEKYNGLIKGTPMADQTLEQVITEAAKATEKTPLFNNGAQIWNHNFYWKSLAPKGGGTPTGKLKEKIDASFGSYTKFKDEFTEKAATLFGSGWAWLVQVDGKLKVVQTKDADTPIVHGMMPLLTMDVWEHAYYLDYQNKRKDYVVAVLDKLMNWDFASENLAKA